MVTWSTFEPPGMPVELEMETLEAEEASGRKVYSVEQLVSGGPMRFPSVHQ